MRVTTPYRTDVDALHERKADLEREAKDIRARHEEITRDLSAIDAQIRAKETPRPHRLLHLRVASPCNEKWDDMVGDESVRFCATCAKHVYNLSAMNRDECDDLIREHAGRGLCVRFFSR